MVEQGTHKPLVGGSNPPSATTFDSAAVYLDDGAAGSHAVGRANFSKSSSGDSPATYRGRAALDPPGVLHDTDGGRRRIGRVAFA